MTVLGFVAAAQTGLAKCRSDNFCSKWRSGRGGWKRNGRVTAVMNQDGQGKKTKSFWSDPSSGIQQDTWPLEREVEQFVTSPVVEASISILVLVQCITFAIESLPIDIFLRDYLVTLDMGISMVFFAEYLLRWYGNGLKPRYLLNRFMVVDLIAISPIFLAMMSEGVNLQFIRLLRVARIFRLQRVLQREEFNKLFGLKASVSDTNLRIAEIVVTVFSILFVSSGLLYEVEVETNPTLDNFFDAFYFILVTLTTVGYGDITPVTALGKFVVSCSIVTGVFLIPYQFGRLAEAILGDMGMMGMGNNNMKETTCVSCGTTRHPADSSFCRICGTRLRRDWGSP